MTSSDAETGLKPDNGDESAQKAEEPQKNEDAAKQKAGEQVFDQNPGEELNEPDRAAESQPEKKEILSEHQTESKQNDDADKSNGVSEKPLEEKNEPVEVSPKVLVVGQEAPVLTDDSTENTNDAGDVQENVETPNKSTNTMKTVDLESTIEKTAVETLQTNKSSSSESLEHEVDEVSLTESSDDRKVLDVPDELKPQIDFSKEPESKPEIELEAGENTQEIGQEEEDDLPKKGADEGETEDAQPIALDTLSESHGADDTNEAKVETVALPSVTMPMESDKPLESVKSEPDQAVKSEPETLKEDTKSEPAEADNSEPGKLDEITKSEPDEAEKSEAEKVKEITKSKSDEADKSEDEKLKEDTKSEPDKAVNPETGKLDVITKSEPAEAVNSEPGKLKEIAKSEPDEADNSEPGKLDEITKSEPDDAEKSEAEKVKEITKSKSDEADKSDNEKLKEITKSETVQAVNSEAEKLKEDTKSEPDENTKSEPDEAEKSEAEKVKEITKSEPVKADKPEDEKLKEDTESEPDEAVNPETGKVDIITKSEPDEADKSEDEKLKEITKSETVQAVNSEPDEADKSEAEKVKEITKSEPYQAVNSEPEKLKENTKSEPDEVDESEAVAIPVDKSLNTRNEDVSCQLESAASDKSTRYTSGEDKEMAMHEDDTSKSMLGSRPIIDEDSNSHGIVDIKEEENAKTDAKAEENAKTDAKTEENAKADAKAEESSSDSSKEEDDDDDDDDKASSSGEKRLGKQRKKNKAQHKITKQSFTGFFNNLNPKEANSSSVDQQQQHAFIQSILGLIVTTLNEVSGLYAGLEQHLESMDKKTLKNMRGQAEQLKKAIKNCKSFAVSSHKAFEKILLKFNQSKLLKMRDASIQILKVHKDEALDLNLDSLLKSTIALVTLSTADKNIAAVLHNFSTPEGLHAKLSSESNQQFIEFKDSQTKDAYCPKSNKISLPKPLDYYDVFMSPFNMIVGFSAWMQSNGSVFSESTDLQVSFKKLSNLFSNFDSNYAENDRITLTRIITCSSRVGSETKPYIICLTSHGLLLYTISKGANSLKFEQYEKYKYCTFEFQGMKQLNACDARLQFFDYHVSTVGIKDEDELIRRQVKLISSVSNYQLLLTLKSMKHPLKLDFSSYSDVLQLIDLKNHHQSKKELKKNDVERVHSLVRRNLAFSSRLNFSPSVVYMYVEIVSGVGFDSSKSYTITGSNAFSHQTVPLMIPVEIEKEFGTKSVSFNSLPALLGSSKSLIIFEDSPGKGKQFEFGLDFDQNFDEILEKEMTVKDAENSMIDDRCNVKSDALYRVEAADSKAISTVAKAMTSLFQFETLKGLSAAELASGLLTWIHGIKLIKYSQIADLLRELISVGPEIDKIKAQFAERLSNGGVLTMFTIFMHHLRFILTQSNNLTRSDLTPAISSAFITEIENRPDFPIEQGIEGAKDLIKAYLN